MRDIYALTENGLRIDNLAQYDSDVYIYFNDSEITAAHTVHFCNMNSTEAFVVASELVTDNTLRVKIPNALLTQPYAIIAYVYIVSDDGQMSLLRARINVAKRPRPSDYVYVDTDDYITLESIRTELLEKIEEIGAGGEGDTNKVLLFYNGTNILMPDGEVATFDEIYNALMESPDFVVLVYNNRAYHPNQVSTEQVIFSSTYPSNGYIRSERITMLDNGTVTVTYGEAEKTSSRVNAIADADKNNTSKYPSVKAVVDYVSDNAGGEKPWRVLNTITLAEDVGIIDITATDTGEPFAVSEVFVAATFEVPTTTTASQYLMPQVMVSGKWQKIINGGHQNTATTLKRYYALRASESMGTIFVQYAYTQYDTGNMQTLSAGTVLNQLTVNLDHFEQPISGVRIINGLSATPTTAFGAGSTIKLLGR